MISNVERTSDAFIDQARIEELLAAGKKQPAIPLKSARSSPKPPNTKD